MELEILEILELNRKKKKLATTTEETPLFCLFFVFLHKCCGSRIEGLAGLYSKLPDDKLSTWKVSTVWY